MTTSIHSANHPVWALARLVLVLTALTLILWMNASEFDNTELQTIIGMFLVVGATEGVPAMLRQFTKKPEGATT